MPATLEHVRIASVASAGITSGLLLATPLLCTATVKRNKELWVVKLSSASCPADTAPASPLKGSPGRQLSSK
jgi:hypothetical protein